MDFTTVIGLDASRIEQFRLTWPNWIKHKPSLANNKLIVFYDKDQVEPEDIKEIVGREIRLDRVAWPPIHTDYEGDGKTKWTNPQRNKMLTGFVYIASRVTTKYWLKLDTDVIATGHDNWVDPKWFVDSPAIIAPGWSYTKPADQMQKLDDWVAESQISFPHEFRCFNSTDALGLIPEKGSNKVIHNRICSWCAFFSTTFSKMCLELARSSCGPFKMPVPSQDGYMWYVAKRLGLLIRPVQMKRHGWDVRNGIKGIQGALVND